MQLKHTKNDLCSVCRRCCDRMNMSKVVCKVSRWRISHWVVLQGWVDQLKLMAIKQTLTESNHHYTTQEIANILKISKSIKLLVQMKNVSFILWKKTDGHFGQPSPYTPTHWHLTRGQVYSISLISCLAN